MNLLIVDDDYLAIEGIKANIEAEQFEIRQVFTANCMEQAKSIVKNNQIHIAICDIEMPNGSGLELIKWINEHAPAIVTIILSCHMEFQFAQTAVGLSCLQYLIKPATPGVLSQALLLAAEQVAKNNSDLNIKKIGQDYISMKAGEDLNTLSMAEQMRQYVISHIEEDITLERLVQVFYMSQNQLSRVFKKKYGKTIVEFVMEYRISLAEEMLKNSNMTVTCISAKIGYPNYAYFTRIFKKFIGYTPSEYRNRYKHS